MHSAFYLTYLLLNLLFMTFWERVWIKRGQYIGGDRKLNICDRIINKDSKTSFYYSKGFCFAVCSVCWYCCFILISTLFKYLFYSLYIINNYILFSMLFSYLYAMCGFFFTIYLKKLNMEIGIHVFLSVHVSLASV